MRRAAARATERDLRRLEEHLAGRDRRPRTPRPAHAIRLSGHFHVILAEIAGNRVLERMVGELVTRTSLIIGMFGGPAPTTAAPDEHDRMLKAIRARDEAAGARLMFEHLAHIEAGLDLSARRVQPVDVIAMFSPGA